MPVVTMPLSEALEKGYEVIGPTPVHRTAPPTPWETGVIIGLDVVPAITGAIVGGLLGGPWGAVAGGGGGGGIGNYWSQQYRVKHGLQEDVSPAELATMTVASAIPLGGLAGKGIAARTAIRGLQGAGLATSELTARTMLQTGELPTAEQVRTTILFGGVMGGALGAAEAKWLAKTLDVDGIEPGMARGDVLQEVMGTIEREGLNNFQRVRPLATAAARSGEVHPGRAGWSDNAAEAENLMRMVESKVVSETEDFIGGLPRAGEPPPAGDPALAEQMSAIGEAFERHAAQDAEVFKPIMARTQATRAVEEGYGDFLVYKGKLEDRMALQRVEERIGELDHKLGMNKGARKERGKLNAEKRRILTKMGMDPDLEAAVRARQGAPAQPTKALTFGDHPMAQADDMSKWDLMAQKLLGENYEKFYNGILTTGTGGAAAYVALTDDEKSEMSRAGLGELALYAMMAGMGYGAFRKFGKTPMFKRVAPEIRRNPEAAEPLAVKSTRVDETLSATDIYPGENRLRAVWDNAKVITGDIFSPISRQLKNIAKPIAAAFRQQERKVAEVTQSYLDRATPFVVTMTKRLSRDDAWKFKNALLMGDEVTVMELARKYKAPVTGEGSYAQMREALDGLRVYAREKGGIDVGYLEGYFPREIRNYKQFREWLDGKPSLSRTRNDLEQALTKESEARGRDLEDDEVAEVVGRILRGYPVRPGEGTAPFAKPRVIQETALMLNAYADPADALSGYVRRVVNATETRAFLRPDLARMKESVVGFPGARQTIRGGPSTSDLGVALRVDESLAGQMAERLGREKGLNLTPEQLGNLQKIIQRRFSGQTMGPFLEGVKNLGYMQTMTSWGSAITQLGDNVFSIHFNGLGNTFEAMAAKRFDFVKHFGLNRHDVDVMTSYGGLSKVLDKMFAFSGLKKLDQWGKNNFMNAAWRKYKKLAMTEKGTADLLDDLVPIFGTERTQAMLKDLRASKIGGRLPDSIAELVWYKFLDISPAAMSEMPFHAQAGNLRILYMLKTFTVKQFDAVRETAGADISKALKLRREGKLADAARIGARGAMNLAGLAITFMAANAGTDVIKDILYGRPTKADRLLQDNLFKLFGANRYLQYQSRRQGPARAVLEGLLPPTAVFDRAWKDISAIAGDDEYKGAMLQGTPLDMIYWRYLGGAEKSKRLERSD